MWAQLTWGFWGLGQAFRSFARDRVWVPFAVFCTLQVVLLMAVTHFYAWPLSTFVAPALRMTLGEPALHYPFNFVALPLVWTRLGVAVDLLLLGLVIGWTYALVDRAQDPSPVGVGRVFGRWWAFVVARFPFQALLVVILILLPGWVIGGGNGPAGNALRLFRGGTVALAIGVEAAFLFVPLYVLRGSVGRSLQSGLSFFFRYPLAVLLLVGIPALLHLPLVWLLGRTETLIGNMAPEIVGWILGLNLVVGALAGCLSSVGASRLHGVIRGRAAG